MSSIQADILIDNVSILTMDDDLKVITEGAVATSGKTIVFAGKSSDLPEHLKSASRVIDGTGKLVMPGLIDMHSHCESAKSMQQAGVSSESYFDNGLLNSMKTMDEEEAKWAALFCYSEAVKNGTTTICDMSRFAAARAGAAKEIGIRAHIAGAVSEPEYGLDSLEDNEQAVALSDDTVSVDFGLWGIPVASKELMGKIKERAGKYSNRVQIRLNESDEEIALCLEKFGRRPIEIAEEFDFLGPETIASQCVKLNDREIAILEEYGVSVALSPISTSQKGEGVARTSDLTARNIDLAFGHADATSGLGSDMFYVMKYAALVNRAMRNDSAIFQAREILEMTIRSASKALKQKTGLVAEGSLADLIIINLHNEHFIPLVMGDDTNLFAHLVFSASGTDVESSIINGKLVMENRTLLNVDEEEIKDHVRKFVKSRKG